MPSLIVFLSAYRLWKTQNHFASWRRSRKREKRLAVPTYQVSLPTWNPPQLREWERFNSQSSLELGVLTSNWDCVVSYRKYGSYYYLKMTTNSWHPQNFHAAAGENLPYSSYLEGIRGKKNKDNLIIVTQLCQFNTQTMLFDLSISWFPQV